MTLIDKHLASCTVDFLFSTDQQRLGAIQFKRFTDPFYIVDRGTVTEKLIFLSESLNKTDNKQFTIKDLEHYVSSVFRSYLNIQAQQSSPAYESWKAQGYHSAERSILGFSKGIIRTFTFDNDRYILLENLERWLHLNPVFLQIWREVIVYLYSKHADKAHKLITPLTTHLLPLLEGLSTKGTHYTPILDIPHILYVNTNLPNEFRHKWRFLFSSKTMGESFSTMLGKIVNKGPTVFIVEDEDHYIFGGYAPESWSLKPTFGGNDSSILFTLSPAMRCFNSTGYNNHYQYLNLNQQTMPNGLGMGGQYNYWGLWIDSEYGIGQSSESCTTYRDYIQLSKRKDFKIRNMEVWAVGDEPTNDDDYGETSEATSVLDKNLESRVMLELAGKQMHSDGLREPENC
ncbi:MTOR-associated protein MEAK7 isoform X2 [Teleopsis dalmanni]|nr:MTOR-associated protein MEAK7 isoform X2 [Teleopsis dalmanni]